MATGRVWGRSKDAGGSIASLLLKGSGTSWLLLLAFHEDGFLPSMLTALTPQFCLQVNRISGIPHFAVDLCQHEPKWCCVCTKSHEDIPYWDFLSSICKDLMEFKQWSLSFTSIPLHYDGSDPVFWEKCSQHDLITSDFAQSSCSKHHNRNVCPYDSLNLTFSVVGAVRRLEAHAPLSMGLTLGPFFI